MPGSFLAQHVTLATTASFPARELLLASEFVREDASEGTTLVSVPSSGLGRPALAVLNLLAVLALDITVTSVWFDGGADPVGSFSLRCFE